MEHYKRIQSMKFKIFKIFYIMKWKWRLFFAWSFILKLILFRFIYRIKIKIIPKLSIDKAQEKMNNILWKCDPKIIGDFLDSPYRFQYFISSGKQPKTMNDCDEFALWATHATYAIYNPYFLNISWVDENGKWKGHNVCIVFAKNKFLWHIGNWGKIGPFTSVSDVIKSICKDKKLIGWTIMDKNKKIIFSETETFPSPDLEIS